MKQLFGRIFLIGVIILLSCNTGCRKETSLPVLSSSPITCITDSTVSCGGFISGDGGGSITTRGVCWDTMINPTITNYKTTDGTGAGAFTSNVTGLSAFTFYYLRAYATNSAGTAYGANVKFMTTSALPVIKTTPVSAIASNSVHSGVVMYSEGKDAVAEWGVCWSTEELPTILNYKTKHLKKSGGYISIPVGLTPNTTYYLRAYATNSAGTAYGDQRSFTTSATVTDFDGNEYNTIIIGQQVWMVENLRTTHYNNGDEISTTSSPTLNISTETSPKYQWVYNGDETKLADYGRLYTWYAIMDSRGVCPSGWHIPTSGDFEKLKYTTGVVDYNMGGKMKEAGTVHWKTPNTGASDSTGFSAVPGGYRESSGKFDKIGYICDFWANKTMSDISTNKAVYELYYNSASLSFHADDGSEAFSVRCLKD